MQSAQSEPIGFSLLRLGGASTWSGPDGSTWTDWMSVGMTVAHSILGRMLSTGTCKAICVWLSSGRDQVHVSARVAYRVAVVRVATLARYMAASAARSRSSGVDWPPGRAATPTLTPTVAVPAAATNGSARQA